VKYLIVLISILVILTFLAPAVNASVTPTTKTPIKHVINIFFENHTFDNFFGMYPENPPGNNSSLTSNISVPLNLLSNSSLLSKLSRIPPGTFSTADPIEGYLPYHEDWNYGLMNEFAAGSGKQSMTYFTASQVSPLWDLAEQYSIADNYFAPQISESAPNTLYYLAGFSPVFNDYGPPPNIPINETIFGEMNNYHISWGVYVNGTSKNFDMSQYISGINNYSSNINSWGNFTQELSNGTLPSVSYVFSQDANGYDMGAPSNILKGELWLLMLINSIETSPIWNSTAVFITWDDPGGYYDQVSPPVFDGVQLGMRLPLIVVSPYAKENYVSNTLMTHSSILSFIDYNWNMPALNHFVSSLPLPLDMFNFNVPYANGMIARGPIRFNNFPLPDSLEFTLNSSQLQFNYSSQFPVTPQIEFSSLPYERNGSYSINLSNLNAGIYVRSDYSVTPFAYSPYAVVLFLLIDAILLFVLLRRQKNGRR